MKRVITLVFITVVSAVLLVPASVSVKGARLSVAGNVALAANQDPGGGGGGATPKPADPLAATTKCTSTAGNPCRCPDGYVSTGLPIIGTAKCIANNRNNGGAIIAYLTLILRLLGLTVGGIIVLMLVIAGIQYITALGDPGQLKAAKGKVTNAITALMLFLLMYAILGFIVPGGIL